MADFQPANDFELALSQTRARSITVQDLLRALLDATLAVPSADAVAPDGAGVRPLLFRRTRFQAVGCFSDRARIGGFAATAPYCLEIRGDALLRRVPPGIGLVINPWTEVAIDISPEGIPRILGDFA